jgi:hypothetical protein
LPLPVAGTVDPRAVVAYFGGIAVVLLGVGAAIVGRQPEAEELRGFWSSDPLVSGLIRATSDALIAS